MDEKAFELYQEEQRSELIKLNQAVKDLYSITEKQLNVYEPPKEQVEVVGRLEVNTEKAVEITNLEAVRDYLTELGDSLSTAIEKSVREPVSELTIKNIADARSETVKVSNLSELTKELCAVADTFKQLPAPVVNVTKQSIELPYSATKPMAVRLSDGKSFYNAIGNAVSNSMASFRNRDGKGAAVLLEPDGSVPVTINCNILTVLDLLFLRELNSFTLGQATTIDTYTFGAVAGHQIAVGDYVKFNEGENFLRAKVTAVNTNTITIDQPFDTAYTTAAICARATDNMAVNGSVTPVIFEAASESATLLDHINSISFDIIDGTQMDDTKFGGINALARGVLIRIKNGNYKNLSVIKSNSDFSLYGETVYSDKAGGGNYGINARRSFAGQDYNNSVINLDPEINDRLQIVIQDDLTGLISFRALAHGHHAR